MKALRARPLLHRAAWVIGMEAKPVPCRRRGSVPACPAVGARAVQQTRSIPRVSVATPMAGPAARRRRRRAPTLSTKAQRNGKDAGEDATAERVAPQRGPAPPPPALSRARPLTAAPAAPVDAPSRLPSLSDPPPPQQGRVGTLFATGILVRTSSRERPLTLRGPGEALVAFRQLRWGLFGYIRWVERVCVRGRAWEVPCGAGMAVESSLRPEEEEGVVSSGAVRRHSRGLIAP